MAGKGGGAWKVAYADFVTAMMAFFLVMWITAQSKDVKESVARYFEDPMGNSDTPKLTGTDGHEQASAMGTYPNGGLNTSGLGQRDPNSTPRPSSKTTTAHKPPKLKIFQKSHLSESRGTMILFHEDSAEMTESGKQQLSTIVPAFLGKPNKIEVRGHTSRKPLPPGSPYMDPWDLSYARCVATMRGLVEGGVAPERIRLSQDADTEPYTDRRESEWQELNSRVEVFAINEFAYEHKDVRDAPGGFFGNADAKAETTEPASHGH